VGFSALPLTCFDGSRSVTLDGQDEHPPVGVEVAVYRYLRQVDYRSDVMLVQVGAEIEVRVKLGRDFDRSGVVKASRSVLGGATFRRAELIAA
jgi:hypothetical protein